MNLLWITDNKDEVPTDSTMDQVKEILGDHIGDIAEAMRTTGEITMFAEIDGWYLNFGFDKKNIGNCYIHHSDKDTWLDKINKHKNLGTKSYWNTEKEKNE